MIEYSHDIAIVGAGPAGSSTAYFLARHGFDVALIDKSNFPRDKTCGDALSPRALHILDNMGLLPTLTQRSSIINHLDFYTPAGELCAAQVPYINGMPHYSLIAPRYQLDEAIQKRALEAGAKFYNFDVTNVIKVSDRVIGVHGREHSVKAKLIVAATGAATGLLTRLGFLRRKPTLMVAARQYFENLPPLADHLEFYFDHIPLPGYGWMFPTSSTSANIGVGYFGKKETSPRTLLEKFYDEHPRVRDFIKNAKPTSPIKGYPLRVDFQDSTLMINGAIGVGEAIGLVNPFTGEGIDYALESGQIAAECITAAGGFTSNHLREYPRHLNDQFRHLFVMTTMMRDLFYNKLMLNRIFGRAAHNEFVREIIVGICLGKTDPLQAFTPKMIWEILKP